MNQRLFEELARQRQADMRRAAARALAARTVGSRTVQASTLQASSARARDTRQSLRARTGWRLVDLGLKLAVQPDSRSTAAPAPRPAGS